MWAETVSGKLVDFPKASQQIQKKKYGGLNGGMVWREFASRESSGSQLVYWKLFPHGPHSSKNNIAKA